MNNIYTMEEFVNKYAKQDVVTYQPQDLKRGDTILVYNISKWVSAMFISYYKNELLSDIKVIALPDNETDTHIYSAFVVIEG